MQRWASGRFEDLGPKRLFIVLEDKKLKIAQEEMLESELLRSKSTKVTDLYFLLDDGMVLHDVPVPEEHGKPELVESEADVLAARASVKDSNIKKAVSVWKGRSVRTDSGCTAKVTGFYLLSRVVPHFATEHDWSCRFEEDEDEDCVEASDEAIADYVFSSENAVVVAELDGCEGRYAHSADLPTFIRGEIIKDGKIEALALKAFAKLEAVVGQEDSEVSESKDWWMNAEDVTITKHPKSAQVLVSVGADNGGMCGEFSASHWEVWEYKKGRLVERASGSPPLRFLEAIDVDGDGTLEFVVEGDNFGSQMALIDSSTLSTLAELSYAYYDCPC